MNAIYFKLYDNLFYKITAGSVTKIDTKRKSLVQTKHTPQCPAKFVMPITEKDYQEAFKSIQ